jgi:outer membrane protein assembly factor BamB
VTKLLLLTLAVATADAAIADSQTNWPGFLGAGQVTVPAGSLPLTWSATDNIAWKAPLPGYGQSSPVVWDGKVFVTTVEGPLKDTCHVTALDLANGKPLWKHSFDSTDKVKTSAFVSKAAPTPVVEARGLFAFFESGDVVGLSHDGQERWRRSLSQDYGKFQNEFGLAASPVQTSEAVILLIDHNGPSYLIALGKSDGKTLWKTDRTPRQSWSSPSLVSIGGKSQVVCSSAGSVDGYDPTTGELLWSYDEVAGNTSSTPLPFAEGQFLVGASPGREGGDRAEGAKKSNLAMTIELVENKAVPKVLWRTEQATPTFGSPVVYAGHAYWINRVGAVYCFDAQSGEPRFTERVKQSSWATPLGVGDRLYLFGKDGLTTVLRSGPKFEVLAENQLWDPAAFKPDPAKAAAESTPERRAAAGSFAGPVLYGVAAADGSLLIRTGDQLYCVRQPAAAQ